MKKVIHVLVFSAAGLTVAGVIFVLAYPRSQSPVPASSPGEPRPDDLSPAKSTLFLGASPQRSKSGAGRTEFRFGEKIYATVVVSRVEPGDHSLVFRWINPRGSVQETFRKEFHSAGGRYRCWSWLELRGEDLFPVSIGPFGTGRFLGRWGIRVWLDDLFLTGTGFVVL
ncbi:MAG: hypothetical protein V1789_06895 [PVC group bacterium]